MEAGNQSAQKHFFTEVVAIKQSYTILNWVTKAELTVKFCIYMFVFPKLSSFDLLIPEL